MVEPDNRNRFHAQRSGGQQPAMAGDNAVVVSDKDRIGPAELANRGRYLYDLRL